MHCDADRRAKRFEVVDSFWDPRRALEIVEVIALAVARENICTDDLPVHGAGLIAQIKAVGAVHAKRGIHRHRAGFLPHDHAFIGAAGEEDGGNEKQRSEEAGHMNLFRGGETTGSRWSRGLRLANFCESP